MALEAIEAAVFQMTDSVFPSVKAIVTDYI
jgi:hypothetical protein